MDNTAAALVDIVRGENPGENWTYIDFAISANVHGYQISPTWDGDGEEGPAFSMEASMLFFDLRREMADAQRGAWLTGKVHIPRTGEGTFSFDWMIKPTWGGLGELEDGFYLDDLQEFPRTPENIPDWYPRP